MNEDKIQLELLNKLKKIRKNVIKEKEKKSDYLYSNIDEYNVALLGVNYFKSKDNKMNIELQEIIEFLKQDIDMFLIKEKIKSEEKERIIQHVIKLELINRLKQIKNRVINLKDENPNYIYNNVDEYNVALLGVRYFEKTHNYLEDEMIETIDFLKTDIDLNSDNKQQNIKILK